MRLRLRAWPVVRELEQLCLSREGPCRARDRRQRISVLGPVVGVMDGAAFCQWSGRNARRNERASAVSRVCARAIQCILEYVLQYLDVRLRVRIRIHGYPSHDRPEARGAMDE